MSINFSPFEIGRRALNANQAGISVTGQNIANVNTAGYSRQRVQLSEAAPAAYNRFSIGGGVTIDRVQAFRDRFVESRIQNETGAAGRFAAQRDALAPVETALQGTDSSGVDYSMKQFFGSFRDLEANPNSTALRAVVAQKGAALATAFHTTRARLDEARGSADGQIRDSVGEVNRLSASIADLNLRIRNAEATGGNASALRDERGVALNQIAELAGARSVENEDGTVNVTIGEGRALVVGDKASELSVTSQPPNGLASISLEGQPAVFDEGRIKGFQNAVAHVGEQIGNLDQLAASVAERVNALHSSGTDQDGNAGTNFFDASQPVTAANINVSAAITANPRLVVASAVAQPASAGTVAGQIANLLTDQNSTVGGRTGSFASIYGSFVSSAGEQVKNAENGIENQAAVLAQATAQREAVSGVSLDEEAINLLQYQKAYDAAARFLKVADEMTQTILSLAQ